MKAEDPLDQDASLHRVLREWKATEPLPPRFNENVWRRISIASPAAVGPVMVIREWFARFALRPAFALSYALVLLAAGLVAGAWQGHAHSERAASALSERYVATVDPYLQGGR